MIITKYLRKNLLRSFLLVFIILLSIFFAQQFIIAFTQVSKGNIPVDFVFQFIMLNMPYLMQYFIPLALFLAVLTTFIRMYKSQEIISMVSCGVEYRRIFYSFLPLTSLVFLFSLANSLYIAPSLLAESRLAIQNFRLNPTFNLIKEGSFTPISGSPYIIFVNKVESNLAKGIYVFDLKKNDHMQLISAEIGEVKVVNNIRQIVLNNGSIFSYTLGSDLKSLLDESKLNLTNPQGLEVKAEPTKKKTVSNLDLSQISADATSKQLQDLIQAKRNNFYQISFKELTLNLDVVENNFKLSVFKFKNVFELWDLNTPKARLEIILRIVNSLSVFLMAALGFVFGKVNPRRGRSSNVITSVSLYFVYLMILNSLTTVVNKGGNVAPLLTLFTSINIIYIVLFYLLANESSVLKRSNFVRWLKNFLGVQ